MAVALEELTAGVLEGAAGPWALAVGVGALAVALAAQPSRSLGRIAARGVVAAEQAGRLRPERWVRGLADGWRALVDEARAEYEAGRRPGAVGAPGQRAPADGTPAAERRVDGAAGAAPDAGASSDAGMSDAASGTRHSGGRQRDRRGRFVRGTSRNGTGAG